MNEWYMSQDAAKDQREDGIHVLTVIFKRFINEGIIPKAWR